MSASDPLDDTKTYNQTGLVRPFPILCRIQLTSSKGIHDGLEGWCNLGRLPHAMG